MTKTTATPRRPPQKRAQLAVSNSFAILEQKEDSNPPQVTLSPPPIPPPSGPSTTKETKSSHGKHPSGGKKPKSQAAVTPNGPATAQVAVLPRGSKKPRGKACSGLDCPRVKAGKSCSCTGQTSSAAPPSSPSTPPSSASAPVAPDTEIVDLWTFTKAEKIKRASDDRLLEAEIAASTQEKVAKLAGNMWIQENIQQRRQVVYSPWYLNSGTMKYLALHFPELQVLPTKEQHTHEHPLLNLGRDWAEVDAYNVLSRFCKKRDLTFDASHKIVDIGGQPSRHARHNRRNVHSTCPVLTPVDALRAMNHYGLPNVCQHTAQLCDCVEPVAYLAVHSLYYLTPLDIARLCLRSAANLLVAVVHEFSDASGSFAAGEANYQITDTHTVQMNVRGNTQAYSHSNMKWMHGNSITFHTDLGPHTLVWAKMSARGDHSVYQFTVSTLAMTPDRAPSCALSAAISSPDYYGDVSLAGVFNDMGKVSVGEVEVSLPDTRVYSWGPSVFLYQSSNRVIMHCPKGAVDAVAAWVAGRDRTADCFKNCLTYVRTNFRKFNLPDRCLDSSMFAAVVLGFVRNVSHEVSLMHGVISPMVPTILVHREALNQKFKNVWTAGKVVAATSTATVLAGLAGKAIAVTAGTTAALAAGAVGVGLGACLLGGMAARAAMAPPIHTQSASSIAFPDQHTNPGCCGPPRTYVQMLPKNVGIPACDPVKSVETIAAMELDPSASVDVSKTDLTQTREKPDAPPCIAGGIVSMFSPPVVPSNSSHSAFSAIKERITKNGPFGKGKVDEEYFSLFRTWVFQNLESLGLPKDSVKAVPFAEWNKHYPQAQQAAHVKALQQLNDGSFLEHLCQDRGMFTKIEGLSKATTDGPSSLAPRAIQSGTTYHNLATGPFCKSFSKRLAAVWNVQNKAGPMYTSGATAEAIGSAYDAMCDRLDGDLAILEGDFARFDSTIHRLLLELEADIYKHTGCSEQAYSAFMSAIDTKGRDKWGTKYKVDGGRHSGDHNTSGGNSVIQGLAILFSLAFHDACVNDAPLMEVTSLCRKYDIALLALGDDNVLTGKASFVSTVPMEDLLLRLGLELEPKLHMGENAKFMATFCSSRFYPVEGGFSVLGPGIGRGIARSGWYVNPPKGATTDQLMRSDSIGRLNDNSFIPFLRAYWTHVHGLTRGAKDIKMSGEMKRSHLHNAHATRKFEPCDETYRMVEAVYGLTVEDEIAYVGLLKQITTLPAIVDYEPVHRAMIIDGVAVDGGQDQAVYQPIEALPTIVEEDFVKDLERLNTTPLSCRCGKRVTACVCKTQKPDFWAKDNDQFVEEKYHSGSVEVEMSYSSVWPDGSVDPWNFG